MPWRAGSSGVKAEGYGGESDGMILMERVSEDEGGLIGCAFLCVLSLSTCWSYML